MNEKDEFTVNIISSASMNIFPENTLASFRNFFSEALILEGDWRVALTEIIFPSQIANVTTDKIKVFTSYGHRMNKNANAPGVISKSPAALHPYVGDQIKITPGIYDDVKKLLTHIKDEGKLDNFAFDDEKITGKIRLHFGKRVGINFPDAEIPSILGFTGIREPRDGSIHLGWKLNPRIDARLNEQENEKQIFTGDFAADLSAGSQLMFVYVDIIGYQFIGDTKTPLLRVIDTNRRLKNGSICSIEPTHRKVFSNLDYKKLFSTTIQSISVQLRTETGKLVPFLGTGKVILSLKFKKFAE